jgi:outer membrane protein OmpA-like peptidoglycan-associated protein
MKKQFVSSAIAVTLFINTAHAGNLEEAGPTPGAHKRQGIGFGVGSVAGAIIGGPPGMVAGGIIGAMAGWGKGLEDDLHAREQALIAARSELTTLETRNGVLVSQAATAPVLDPVAPERQLDGLGKALTTNFSLDIYFRSGSSGIEPYYERRLDAIAALLNAFTDLDIELEGHADRRGTDLQNIKLSTERVHAVKAALMSAGVNPTRMLGKPQGERKPVTRSGDAQAYAFDRRVQLRLSVQRPGDKLPVAVLESAESATD